MEKNRVKSHSCVFSNDEISQLRRMPLVIEGISSTQKLIVVFFVAILALLLLPSGFLISQSREIGNLSSASAEAIRARERQFQRIEVLDRDLKSRLKQLYWAEQHAKKAKEAVERLAVKIDRLAKAGKNSPSD